ncbi:MAG: polysaccharide biosynthesis tyrosine autokinase [Blastocatellia bacterium]|nr:polysaccharide biosynthesis tyrosine autokinase [Blastocatellia bacterium]
MSDERLELEKLPPPESIPLARPGYPRAVYPDPGSYGYGYGYGEQDGRALLRQISRILRKRKWLILTLVFIGTCITTVEIYRTQSTYQAAATIEIRNDSKTLVKTADVIVQTDASDNINTYIYMIKSRPLLQNVALNLKLDQNPNFLEVTERKSVWEAVKTISGKFRSGNPSAPTPQIIEPPDIALQGELKLTPEETARLAPVVSVLANNLNVEQLPFTRVLKISFTHTDPMMAARVTNAVAQDFIERRFQEKTVKFTKASAWLDDATRKLRAQVEQAEKKLADYTRDHIIYSGDIKDTLGTDKFMRLHEQVMRVETDRVLKESLLAEVMAGRVNQLAESFANSETAELQKKLNELKIRASQLELKFGEKNPNLIDVKQQIAALEEQIAGSRSTLAEKLKAEYERILREERSLKKLLAAAKIEAAQQNQATIEYSLLKQDVDTAKALYTEFLQKTHQADIQVAEQANDLRLAEPAEVPVSPVGPNRPRAILIGLFLSLAAGCGLAYFLEYLDNTIKTVEDVSRYAQLPALSVIPAIGATMPRKLSGGRKALATRGSIESSLLISPEARSSAAEAYRVLRTSVLLSSAGSPPKKILITSGQPGEGKTTTVVNTAISLAQLGSSVIIIDCDLRKPTIHKLFGFDHGRGLSTYLSRDVELDSLIQKLQIPNLSALACGPIPPNPAELISSEKMKSMLAKLSERYDHIVIDSPPLINVTDPVILSTLVDGVILVVHGGKSTRDVLRRARQELTNVGAKIFGVVLNNVDLRHEGYDDYYYYRYYSAYGQEKEESSD